VQPAERHRPVRHRHAGLPATGLGGPGELAVRRLAAGRPGQIPQYALAAALGLQEHAGQGNAETSPFFGGSAAIHQQIADGYNFDCDFTGQARSAFALDGTGTVLFEVRGQSDDWGQRQLVQLVQVVLAGVLGMAERMADGSVDTLNGDFYPTWLKLVSSGSAVDGAASLGCTTNSYSSINPSSVNASGSFTPPTNSPLPDSRLSC
jgi:hypothetical protein